MYDLMTIFSKQSKPEKLNNMLSFYGDRLILKPREANGQTDKLSGLKKNNNTVNLSNKQFFRPSHHFYFLLPISRESIVFGSNFRNGDFDGFTRFEVL